MSPDKAVRLWLRSTRRVMLGSSKVRPAIGRCADYEGFRGAERDFGRYTVRHPGTDAIDLYADPAERAPHIASLDVTPPWETAAIGR